MENETPKITQSEKTQSDDLESTDAQEQVSVDTSDPTVFVPKDKMHRPGDTVRLSENKGMLLRLGETGLYEHVGYLVEREAEQTDK